MLKTSLVLCILLGTGIILQNQASSKPQSSPDIPRKLLDFKAEKSGFDVVLPPVTSLPQCSADGSLFIDLLDMKDLSKHTLVSVYGQTVHTYLPAAIPDLHDVRVSGFFPSESIVGLLTWATKEVSNSPGAGKSPAGYSWSSYHNYIAEFDRTGSYRGSIELPISYRLQRIAIFPTGDLLVAGYDQGASQAKVSYIDSSQRIVRTVDFPAERLDNSATAAPGSLDASKAATALMGHIGFSAYNDKVLVWHSGTADPILEVSSGGKAREVPLQPPVGSVLVNVLPSNDRWVGLFQEKSAGDNATIAKKYSYYELRPQDGSVSYQLVESGEIPLSIACESSGRYFAYKRDTNNTLVLITAQE